MKYNYQHTQPDGVCRPRQFALEQPMDAPPYTRCVLCQQPIERVLHPGLRPIGGGTPTFHS